MIALAEYVSLSAGIQSLGKETDEKIAERVADVTKKKQATQIATDLAKQYQSKYLDLLQDGLMDAATTIAETQIANTGVALTAKEIAENALHRQLTAPYWGATLTQRILVNERRLFRNIHRTSHVGIDKLGGIFTEAVPFGAHTSIDKRVALGTIAKMERDIAQTIAGATKHKLIRWSLSHRHQQKDVCDDLASNVDKDVVQYLNKNNIDEDARGLYFAADLPDPPHPNCQCDHSILTPGQRRAAKTVRRAISKIRKIIRRLRKK